MSVPSDLLSRVLELPEADRAELASELLASLGPDDPAMDPADEEPLDEYWIAEIERRSRAVEEGRGKLLTKEEFEERIQKVIDEGKAAPAPKS